MHTIQISTSHPRKMHFSFGYFSPPTSILGQSTNFHRIFTRKETDHRLFFKVKTKKKEVVGAKTKLKMKATSHKSTKSMCA